MNLCNPTHLLVKNYGKESSVGGYENSLREKEDREKFIIQQQQQTMSGRSDPDALSIDNSSFCRMCKDTPGLAKNIGRTDVDLVFTRTKPSSGQRRLTFDCFLDALLELSMKIYPEDEPTKAMSMFLARYLFGLFEQTPSPQSYNIVEAIHSELALTGSSHL